MLPAELAVPDISEVRDAAERIRHFVHHTPILTSASLNDFCGREVYVKAEHLQLTGAYKVRGGTNFVQKFLERGEIPSQGVIADSSGNHGLGVEWAARTAGIAATIVLPSTVVDVKLAAIQSYGARTILTAPDHTVDLAAELAAGHNLINIPPYDHSLIIAGQGTCALEALADIPSVDAIVVPIGGGALAAGTVLATGAQLLPSLVYGVEPDGADDTRRSIEAGRRVSIAAPSSVADGLLPDRPGEVTFAINEHGLEGVVTVSDAEIRAAVRFVAQRMKQLIEPSAAVTIAALAAGSIPGSGPVLAIFSGGNADLGSLMSSG